MTYNRITIRGHVGADPEVKYVDPVTPVARFSVATDAEGYVSPDGHFALKPITEWHTVYCYYRLAEVVDASVFKGMEVEVEGRLSYTTIYRGESLPRKVAYIVIERIEDEERAPRGESPNNPYGAYLDFLEKGSDGDMPF